MLRCALSCLRGSRTMSSASCDAGNAYFDDWASGIPNKKLLVAYTRAAVINSVQQANLTTAEQINQGQAHTQS